MSNDRATATRAPFGQRLGVRSRPARTLLTIASICGKSHFQTGGSDWAGAEARVQAAMMSSRIMRDEIIGESISLATMAVERLTIDQNQVWLARSCCSHPLSPVARAIRCRSFRASCYGLGRARRI